jgi:hypothetical protein
MIYFPETLNTISTMSLKIFTLSSWSYARELTLCMLAFWSHEGVVFLDFLPSPHLVTSFRLSCLGSTDAHCPRLGDPVPLHPKWHPFSQGPRTLPYRDPEHLVLLLSALNFRRKSHRAQKHILYAGEKIKFFWLMNYYFITMLTI